MSTSTVGYDLVADTWLTAPRIGAAEPSLRWEARHRVDAGGLPYGDRIVSRNSSARSVQVRALEDGRVLWTRKLDGEPQDVTRIGDTLFVDVWNGHHPPDLGFDSTSGALRWRCEGGVYGSPSDVIEVSKGSPGDVVRYDPWTGERLREDPRYLAEEGRLLDYEIEDGTVTATTRHTETITWTTSLPRFERVQSDGVVMTLVQELGSTLYVQDAYGKGYGIDTATGSLLWGPHILHEPPEPMTPHGNVVGLDDHHAVLGDERPVGFDPSTGRVQWTGGMSYQVVAATRTDVVEYANRTHAYDLARRDWRTGQVIQRRHVDVPRTWSCDDYPGDSAKCPPGNGRYEVVPFVAQGMLLVNDRSANRLTAFSLEDLHTLWVLRITPLAWLDIVDGHLVLEGMRELRVYR